MHGKRRTRVWHYGLGVLLSLFLAMRGPVAAVRALRAARAAGRRR